MSIQITDAEINKLVGNIGISNNEKRALIKLTDELMSLINIKLATIETWADSLVAELNATGTKLNADVGVTDTNYDTAHTTLDL